MIELSTGAILDKELSIEDYSDGRKYGPRLGWLSTFVPCDYCKTKCKKQTFGACDDAYLEIWKKQFLNGGQMSLANWGVRI